VPDRFAGGKSLQWFALTGVHALLHVDDDNTTALVFRAALEEANIRVSVYRVSDGEQALTYLRRLEPYTAVTRPDLVFLDLDMPRVDGWEVLAAMKDDINLRSIPIVVLTTAGHQAQKERVYALGAKHYITKPAAFDVLVAEVTSACRKFLA
jgi:CheY-like chemotaxis protein